MIDQKKKMPVQIRLAILPCPLCLGEATLKRNDSIGLWTHCRDCKATVSEKTGDWISWYVAFLHKHDSSIQPLIQRPHKTLVEYLTFVYSQRSLTLPKSELLRLEEKTRRARIEASRMIGDMKT